MHEEGEFFEEFAQIPLKEFSLGLRLVRVWGSWSLRREYLAKEQLQ